MSVKGAQLPWHLPPSQNTWAIVQLTLADTMTVYLLLMCLNPIEPYGMTET